MATYLAAIVILALVVRGIVYFVQHRPAALPSFSFDRGAWGRLLACLTSGILFTNFLPHFVHGISGETFPAPFAIFFGAGLEQNLANVVWGFINLVLGYNLFVVGRVAGPGKLSKVVFFAGVLGMGIFLSVVFSHGGR